MKKQTLLKKIAKLGLEVDDNGTRCYIVHNGKIASWFYQNDWQTGEPYALNFHIKSVGQESDPYTDYYPGYFLDNATQLLNTYLPTSFLSGLLFVVSNAASPASRLCWQGWVGHRSWQSQVLQG